MDELYAYSERMVRAAIASLLREAGFAVIAASDDRGARAAMTCGSFAAAVIALPDGEAAQRDIYRQALQTAYRDFVDSDAQTEKVFKVFKQGEPQVAFVSMSDIRRA